MTPQNPTVVVGETVSHATTTKRVITYDERADQARVPVVTHHVNGESYETDLIVPGPDLQLLAAQLDHVIAQHDKTVRAGRAHPQ